MTDSPQEAASASSRHPSTIAGQPPSEWVRPNNPIKAGEILAILGTLALWDIAVFGGLGYAAFALLLVSAPVLWLVGSPLRNLSWTVGIVGGMLVFLAARMVWSGSPFAVLLGLVLLVGYSMTLAGYRPFVLESILFALQTSVQGLVGQGHALQESGPHAFRVKSGWRSILIPALVVMIFVIIFVFANPVFRELLQTMADRIRGWLERFPVSFNRILFWFLSLWCIGGLIRPIVLKDFQWYLRKEEDALDRTGHSLPFDLFSIARNTLFAVVGLFIPYICFEVYYYWVHDIPAGYSYSSYAHEGAFWLTLALAFSTFTLGAIFRGPLLDHPQLPLLQRLTWIWSGLNYALAICIVYRVAIYVNYNGLSKMRVVALFGIAAVAAGFSLVVVKVLKGKSLVWLIRRDLWALFLVCFLFTICPVDMLTTRYNVSQILAGNPAPSVLLSVHPIGAEGIPELLPLINSENDVIRQGAWALLKRGRNDLQVSEADSAPLGWKTHQLARTRALEILAERESEWDVFEGSIDTAEQRFNNYARQWFD